MATSAATATGSTKLPTLTIDFTSTTSAERTNIEIFDIQGKRIMNTIRTNESIYTLNISNLESGVYLVKLTLDSGKTSIQKLILD